MIKGFDFNFLEFILSMVTAIIVMSGAYYSLVGRIKRLEELSAKADSRVNDIEVKIGEQLSKLSTAVSEVNSKLIELSTTIRITNDFNKKGSNS